MTTGCFDVESPTNITLDAKNTSSFAITIKPVVVTSDGTETPLTGVLVEGGTISTDISFTCSVPNIVSLRLLFEYATGEGGMTVYVDNIRFTEGGSQFLWDSCESHPYWSSQYDANNPMGAVINSNDLTPHRHSSNLSSTKSLGIHWNHTDGNNKAELSSNLNMDFSDAWYFNFDVYRPSSTHGDNDGNQDGYLFLYDGSTYMYSKGFRITAAETDQWLNKTVEFDVIGGFNLSKVIYIGIVLTGTDNANNLVGEMYFDNLQARGLASEATPYTPSGYAHIVKDFNDESLAGNDFYGYCGVGGSDKGDIPPTLTASFTPTLSKGDYHSAPAALKLDYELNLDGTTQSQAYYFQYLQLNSQKQSLSLWLKSPSDSVNPGQARIEFKDDDGSGVGYCYISGITTFWKQWDIPINSSNLTLYGDFDVSKICQIVIMIDSSCASKLTGTLLIDDIVLYDASDTLTGLVSPEATATPVKNMGLPYMLDDFDNRVLDLSQGSSGSAPVKENDVGGIGQNQYLTASAMGSYYIPLASSDAWNGTYVTVSEPPKESSAEITVQAPVPYTGRLSSKKDMIKAAIFGLGGILDDESKNPYIHLYP
jgi:hypothetical protein